jgi:quercetin dioxygenase-like cupin family protein
MEIDRTSPAETGRAGSAKRFTGTVRLSRLPAPDDTPEAPSAQRFFHVHFAPGSRTAWHSHPHGQFLHVTSGTGRVQQRGGPVQEITEGDTISTGPDVWHWHGAGPDTAMSHLSVQLAATDGTTSTWGEHVPDSEFNGPLERH